MKNLIVLFLAVAASAAPFIARSAEPYNYNKREALAAPDAEASEDWCPFVGEACGFKRDAMPEPEPEADASVAWCPFVGEACGF